MVSLLLSEVSSIPPPPLPVSRNGSRCPGPRSGGAGPGKHRPGRAGPGRAERPRRTRRSRRRRYVGSGEPGRDGTPCSGILRSAGNRERGGLGSVPPGTGPGTGRSGSRVRLGLSWKHFQSLGKHLRSGGNTRQSRSKHPQSGGITPEAGSGTAGLAFGVRRCLGVTPWGHLGLGTSPARAGTGVAVLGVGRRVPVVSGTISWRFGEGSASGRGSGHPPRQTHPAAGSHGWQPRRSVTDHVRPREGAGAV